MSELNAEDERLDEQMSWYPEDRDMRDPDGDDASGGAVQGGTGSLPDASGSGSPKSAHIDGTGCA
jgi:hypothetical protein